jgi:hypothetical protein
MNKGFGTLYIVIILGSAALGLALYISTSSFWSIRGSIDGRQSDKAKALANACAEIALEMMRENNSYAGSDDLSLEGSTCNYSVSNTGGATRLVEVSATVGNIVRKLEISTSAFNPIEIEYWQEVP